MAIDPIEIGAARRVGPGNPALIVAEIGQNHNGSVAVAEALIDAAAWAGADAIKLVKRDLDCELTAAASAKTYDSPHAYGRTYGEHRRALELTGDDHERLYQRARHHGLACVATACDVPSAELLQSIGVDAVKIASRDLSNGPLISYVVRFGRPAILSTGMSTWSEIDSAVAAARRGSSRLLLMHCTSLYPTPLEEAHLRSLPAIAERYGELTGFSDHSAGILLAPTAVALGAMAIEKHITLDRTQKGTDHACSLEPEELRQLVQNVRQIELALGRDDKPAPRGVAPVRARIGRSLVARSRLPAGVVLHERMLVLKSPGDGIPWNDRSLVIGRRLARDVEADSQLKLEDVQ